MIRILSLCCAVFSAAALAGPLDEKKAQAHLEAVAAGNVPALMSDYAADALLEWVGGPLDGRYRGRAAIQEVWKRWAAANDSGPRPAQLSKLQQFANPKGAALQARAEYGGKTPLKVWHVLVYRDAELVTELWQIAPALQVAD